MGDPGKLRTAFRNIIANAVEAVSRKGVIRVRLENRGSVISVAVTDSGCGMTAETAARVFEPYFSTKGSGTGLGLPIAKKIIEDHGGTIAVESEPGRGTTVTVELPVGS
jgi:signal transduction histidine kinase